MVDLAAFRSRLRNALQCAQRGGMDMDAVAGLFGDAQSICGELAKFREGARRRTLEEAQAVAALDRELSALSTTERNEAVMARLNLKRTKLYRLRDLARRPV